MLSIIAGVGSAAARRRFEVCPAIRQPEKKAEPSFRSPEIIKQLFP